MIITGKVRQGKGILATREALKAADKGKKVLSNFYLDSPNAKKIDFYDLVHLLDKPRRDPPVTIVIDEIQGWLDSYVGMSKASRLASYLVFQSAKLGYSMICTTQIIMRAFNSLRIMATHRYRAVHDKKNKQFCYAILNPNNPDEDELTGNSFSITYKQASSFWNRYDTYERVEPVGIKEMLYEIAKTDSRRMNKIIDKQLMLLLANKENLKYGLTLSSIGIKSALLELNEPTVFYDHILYRLKQLQKYRDKRDQQIKIQINEENSLLLDNNKKLLEWKKLQFS